MSLGINKISSNNKLSFGIPGGMGSREKMEVASIATRSINQKAYNAKYVFANKTEYMNLTPREHKLVTNIFESLMEAKSDYAHRFSIY